MATVTAGAQDMLITTDGRQTVGRILGTTPTGQVQVEISAGSTINLPLGLVKEVRLASVPPEFAGAQKAVEQRAFDQALTLLRGLEKYRGLPVDWAQQASAMIGDVYLEKGDLPRAEQAYGEFQRFYPAAGGVQTEVSMARLAAAKKDFTTAKAKIEPIVARALEDKAINRLSGAVYAQALLVLGTIKEGENDLTAALDNYLKVVTIFYYDRPSVIAAQEKADALRQSNPAIFIP